MKKYIISSKKSFVSMWESSSIPILEYFRERKRKRERERKRKRERKKEKHKERERDRETKREKETREKEIKMVLCRFQAIKAENCLLCFSIYNILITQLI